MQASSPDLMCKYYHVPPALQRIRYLIFLYCKARTFTLFEHDIVVFALMLKMVLLKTEPLLFKTRAPLRHRRSSLLNEDGNFYAINTGTGNGSKVLDASASVEPDGVSRNLL